MLRKLLHRTPEVAIREIDVIDVIGGYTAREKAGLPTEINPGGAA